MTESRTGPTVDGHGIRNGQLDERPRGALTGSDVVVSTAVGIVMVGSFWIGSHGNSLRVTFVPGVLVACLVMLGIWRTGRELPPGRVALPWFFAALAVQFVHFAEEYSTGFAVEFPAMYGGTPYEEQAFVTFNMMSYSVFALAAVGLWCLGRRQLLMPVLFFTVYGVCGNAFAHLWWTVQAGRYFPGMYTSLLYWVLGPILVHLFLRQARLTVAFVVLYPTMGIILLTVFQTRSP